MANIAKHPGSKLNVKMPFSRNAYQSHIGCIRANEMKRSIIPFVVRYIWQLHWNDCTYQINDDSTHCRKERVIRKIFNHNEKLFDRNRHRYYRVWKHYDKFSHVAYYQRDRILWRDPKYVSVGKGLNFVSIASSSSFFRTMYFAKDWSIENDTQAIHIIQWCIYNVLYIFQVCLVLLLLLLHFSVWTL